MYYNYHRSNLFDPKSGQVFKISRSKLELFINCPRCFYLDRRFGISQPGGYPFTLNMAVDKLLKKEFDLHRAKGDSHPLMKAYKIEAVPFNHPKMDQWRNNFEGIQVLHKATNFLVFGAIDDMWLSPKKELIVVDYKATSVNKEVTLDDEWKDAYKRQMEIYQWLMRHNQDLTEYKVSDTGYFVYVNGKTDREAFDARLEFDVKIIPYKGNGSWVEKAILQAHQCLSNDKLPQASDACDFCKYRKSAKGVE